ncbi:MAG: acyl carrier protein [Bacteroidales bacterium]|nr:acyl carrier protein [Bacteroidales bacterium]
MKARILELLSDALPAVDFSADFLFTQIDSLGVATIMMILSDEYKINLQATDVTPKNLRSLDSIVAMVQAKLEQK